jgi:hypothetical protein
MSREHTGGFGAINRAALCHVRRGELFQLGVPSMSEDLFVEAGRRLAPLELGE